ncbi:MAG: class I SAM-dependent methyltransferase [Thermoleophilia bacterium]|nr:class I SAM-dependent methyltransferase [Thermoleophilia bacterium]
MAHERSSFYRRVLEQLLAEAVLDREMSVLVVAGGSADRDAFHSLGFERVTISNVDETVAAEELAPYEWSYQDAESLDFPDESFDVTVVSAGLHHCRSPHRALLELYRVARVAAIALESRDSSLMRLAVRLGAVDEYELAAVAAHGLRSGGVANTSTPNFVYRWSEREVEKTVASFAPHARHRIRFFREFELPEALVEIDRGARAQVLRLATPVVEGITRVLPRQANLFAFAVEKPRIPDDLQPWMTVDAGELRPDPEVVGRRYGDAPVGLERHQQDWDRLAEVDALWAVLTVPGRKGGRWDVDEFFATGEAEIAHVAAVAETLGRPARRERALDFGSGVGRLTRALSKRFSAAVGVDISPGMVEHARRLNDDFPACEFRLNASADLAQLESGSFDLVYSSIALQHVATVGEIERYVTEFLRVVRPDGLVVFGLPYYIPALWSFQPRRRIYALLRQLGVSEQWMLRRTPLTPMRMTTIPEADVRALLERHGASVLHTEPIDEGPIRALRYYVSPA